MSRNSLLVLGGLAAIALFGVGWYLTEGLTSSAPAGPQNAVNPNAQTDAGLPAGGTMPDIGNLLSYNQAPGATLSAPQATSVVTGVWG
jgi:hypothetical protein